MKKLLKVIISLIILVIVLCAIAVVLLIVLVNPNRYKEQISAQVRKATGREFVIQGDIDRSFFPWLGVRIHQVRMGNAAGFQPQDTFMKVGEADVSVKLLPLFSGKIQVGKVALDDVTLNLAKNAQGQTNFADLLNSQHKVSVAETTQVTQSSSTVNNGQSLPASTTTENQTVTTQTHKKSFTIKEISVAEIALNNANVNWVNDQAGEQAQVSNLQLKVNNISRNKPFSLHLQYDLQNNKPNIAGHFSFDGLVTLNSLQQMYTFQNLRFTSQLADKKIPSLTFAADNLVVDAKQYTMALTNASLQANNMTATMNAQLDFQPKQALQYKGHLTIPEFNAKSLLSSLGKPLATEDPAALQHVALGADFIGTTNTLQLTNVSGHVDDSLFQGGLAITNIAKQVFNFDVGINQLNLDRYLPPKSASNTAGQPATTPATVVVAAATSATGATNKSPYADLRNMTINGSLRISTLTVAKTVLNNVTARLALANGVAQINPLTATAYQGTTQGQVKADFRSDMPHYAIDETMTDIQVNQLAHSDRLTGTANITAHVTLQGDGKAAMLGSLNGTTQLNIKNGSLLGVDIPYQLERIEALVSKQAIPAAPTENKTDFSVISGSGTFKNGVFNNNDLLIESPQFKITGNGTANLVTQGLDYHLNANGKATTANPSGILGNTSIPILVTGTFSKPIINPDLRAIATELLKSRVGERLQEGILGGAHPIVKERAGELLRRFLQ